MAVLSPAELAERLTLHDDPQVSGWATRVSQRAATRQISLAREYGRLLAPFVEAGLVIASDDGYLITLAGERVVRSMLAATPERTAVAA